MKRIKALTSIPYFLVLAAPVFLAGCDSMSSPFARSDVPYGYDNHDYRRVHTAVTGTDTGTESTTAHKEVKDVTAVEPGMSTVKTPSVTPASTTSTVTTDAPMVPGAAPVLGQ